MYPPPLRFAPRGAEKGLSSRDAYAPELCQRSVARIEQSEIRDTSMPLPDFTPFNPGYKLLQTTNFAPRKRGKRSAERRIQPMSVLIEARQRANADTCARTCATYPLRGAPAFRRSTAALASTVATALAQLQTHVSWRRPGPGVLPRLGPIQCCELLADRSLCRPSGAPEPPGCGVQIRPRAPPSLRFSGLPSGKAPSMSEITARNITSDKCQDCRITGNK
jgi:hypothetical protein